MSYLLKKQRVRCIYIEQNPFPTNPERNLTVINRTCSAFIHANSHLWITRYKRLHSHRGWPAPMARWDRHRSDWPALTPDVLCERTRGMWNDRETLWIEPKLQVKTYSTECLSASSDKEFAWLRLHRNMAVSPYTQPPFSEHRARKSHVNTPLDILLYVLLTKGIDQTSVWKAILLFRSLVRSFASKYRTYPLAIITSMRKQDVIYSRCSDFGIVYDASWLCTCECACVRIVYICTHIAIHGWQMANGQFYVAIPFLFFFSILLQFSFYRFIRNNELFLLLVYNVK